MITNKEISNLAFDMKMIGLNIDNKEDIKKYIERLEESIKTAKSCLD